MDNVSVLKRDGLSRTVTQLAENLTYAEALRLVWTMREKGDGHGYWIGRL